MKAAIIPAQITTVEDRIAANLNFTQILLLTTPLFISAIDFFVLPPIGRYVTYKLAIAIVITCSLSFLAIRVKEKLVLDLIKLRFKYFLRPDIYVYQPGFREDQIHHQLLIFNGQVKTRLTEANSLSTNAKTSSQKLLVNKHYKVSFLLKSGGLVVRVNT
ncbi:MAG: hypothetical protein ACYCPS_04730 [Candidatus Saccharimonadales bacterium]